MFQQIRRIHAVISVKIQERWREGQEVEMVMERRREDENSEGEKKKIKMSVEESIKTSIKRRTKWMRCVEATEKSSG